VPSILYDYDLLCSTDTLLSPWIRPGYVSHTDTYCIHGGYVSSKYLKKNQINPILGPIRIGSL
jgi:hypothetical protein